MSMFNALKFRLIRFIAAEGCCLNVAIDHRLSSTGNTADLNAPAFILIPPD